MALLSIIMDPLQFAKVHIIENNNTNIAHAVWKQNSIKLIFVLYKFLNVCPFDDTTFVVRLGTRKPVEPHHLDSMCYSNWPS